jgi:hypothetical protein
MPEQLLHGTQICAVVEQMSGKRVPQGVRMSWSKRSLVNYSSHIAWSQSPTA